MNNNIVLVLAFVLLSGCSTVKTDRSHLPTDCASGAKGDDCVSAVNSDKKTQKKVVEKQAEQPKIERSVRSTKVVENKKLNDEKMKPKSSPLPLPEDNAVASKQDAMAQKKIEKTKHEKDVSESMDCVKNNIKKADDGKSNVRSVAYEVAVLCTKKGVHVEAIANASIPLVLQNRASKK